MGSTAWIIILVVIVVCLLIDDIHLRVVASHEPERDSHGRFRRHADAVADASDRVMERKIGHPADEPLPKERI